VTAVVLGTMKHLIYSLRVQGWNLRIAVNWWSPLPLLSWGIALQCWQQE
jgi:hypothetical protein